ncbi:MAG: hypothetical protein ABIF89_02795 [bacterium]
MKEKGFTKIAFISLTLVFIAIAVVAYFSLLEPIIQWSPFVRVVTSLPEEELADWRVYQNDNYGFQIKYPMDWYPSGKASSSTFASFLNADATVELIITAYSDKSYSSMTDFFEYLDEIRSSAYSQEPTVKVLSEEKVKVGKSLGKRRKIFLTNGDFAGLETFFSDKNNVFFGVTLYFYNNHSENITEEEIKLSNSIISSFKTFETY